MHLTQDTHRLIRAIHSLSHLNLSHFDTSSWFQIFENHQKNLQVYEALLSKIPIIKPDEIQLNHSTIGFKSKQSLSPDLNELLYKTAQKLIPWRKGPFDLFGHLIDSEWRSDQKWERIKEVLQPLENTHILDVGCGNGYYMFRMLAYYPASLIGLDVSMLSLAQYTLMSSYLKKKNLFFLLVALESFIQNEKSAKFDRILSMGVIYHKRDPLIHLTKLKQALHPEGKLLLETLISCNETLIFPTHTYAGMKNVWFIPSIDLLVLWLKKIGFKHIELIDKTQTSPEEQRRTEWMTGHSLADFLMKGNSDKTIEGYCAPVRASFLVTC